ETQAAVASLTDLLRAPAAAPVDIRHRTVDATMAAGISETIDIRDATSWWQGALGELRATLRAQGVAVGGAGGVYANELFSLERGLATLFVPVQHPVNEVGRVRLVTIPAVELATTIHEGPPS